MAERKQIYTRLTGRRRTLSGYTQLWLGANHILLVKSTYFVEEYRRFALSDIQAIVITGLADRAAVQAAVALAAIAWTSGILVVDSIFVKIFLAVTGAFALGMLIRDIARGQRCICHLQTAVSRELLAPVSRLRGAGKFLALIRPAIQGVQGSLGVLGPMDAPRATVSIGPPEVEHPGGYAPEILFGLMLVDAMLVFLDQRFPDIGASGVVFASMIAEFTLAALVLFRTKKWNVQRLIQPLALIALVCISWDAVGWLRTVGRWGLETVATLQLGKPVITSFTWELSRPEAWFASLWRLAVGLTGLTILYSQRKGERS